MKFKFSDVDARIVIKCKTPRRPLELLIDFEGTVSYSYLCQRLSVLHALGVLVRRNLRERGRNASWYSIKSEEFVKEAEKTLSEESDEVA